MAQYGPSLFKFLIFHSSWFVLCGFFFALIFNSLNILHFIIIYLDHWVFWGYPLNFVLKATAFPTVPWSCPELPSFQIRKLIHEGWVMLFVLIIVLVGARTETTPGSPELIVWNFYVLFSGMCLAVRVFLPQIWLSCPSVCGVQASAPSSLIQSSLSSPPGPCQKAYASFQTIPHPNASLEVFLTSCISQTGCGFSSLCMKGPLCVSSLPHVLCPLLQSIMSWLVLPIFPGAASSPSSTSWGRNCKRKQVSCSSCLNALSA